MTDDISILEMRIAMRATAQKSIGIKIRENAVST